jgi:regulation of enolase protein 1 (concanavalin A-like superfamily)
MVMIDGAMSFTPQEAIKGKQLWMFDQAGLLIIWIWGGP